MLYWDTSALVAFLISEKSSVKLRAFLEKQGSSKSYTAMITPLEFESAIQRRLSDRTLDVLEADQARLFIADFRKRSFFVPLDHNTLDVALHLQKIYALRPGDSLQLASARIGTDNPAHIQFLSLDEKLTYAAKR